MDTEELNKEKEHVTTALREVKQKISKLAKQLQLKTEPRLVAVSKTKPSALIKFCYDEGHRDFGENYVQELVDKAKELPKDIRWHFIGHLQKNKCKMLLEVPNLAYVETVDSVKLASALNKHAQTRSEPLKVFVQVNTSGEESKSGISPTECSAVVENILKEQKFLKFCGLMTIGEPDPNHPERDFRRLVECKKDICSKLGLSSEDVELSMGMSSDYEKAIEEGSTNVRVGSTIFGHRVYANK